MIPDQPDGQEGLNGSLVGKDTVLAIVVLFFFACLAVMLVAYTNISSMTAASDKAGAGAVTTGAGRISQPSAPRESKDAAH